MLFGFEGMPLVTTSRVLAPVSMFDGTSNVAETDCVGAATPMNVKPCVRA